MYVVCSNSEDYRSESMSKYCPFKTETPSIPGPLQQVVCKNQRLTHALKFLAGSGRSGRLVAFILLQHRVVLTSYDPNNYLVKSPMSGPQKERRMHKRRWLIDLSKLWSKSYRPQSEDQNTILIYEQREICVKKRRKKTEAITLQRVGQYLSGKNM